MPELRFAPVVLLFAWGSAHAQAPIGVRGGVEVRFDAGKTDPVPPSPPSRTRVRRPPACGWPIGHAR